MSACRHIVMVGGGGRAGFPLGLMFANQPGLQVTLLDIDPEKVEKILRGQVPFPGEHAEILLRQVIGKSLTATTDESCLEEASVVITLIGTPVDGHLNPTVHDFMRTTERLLDRIRDDSLLILRSTVYPGVTQLVYERIKALGRRIHLAYCPDRSAEGKALAELPMFPQIVGAFEPEARRRAAELFQTIAPNVIELEPMEAELAKLFANTWRYIHFAIANQFYMLAQSHGVDFYRIYEAMTRDYPRMWSLPRAGFTAGPCLLKDTVQLSVFSANAFQLGQAAMQVNEGLPNFVVEQLAQQHLSARRVAILGMAFKGDSSDRRQSLAYRLRKLLEVRAREVLCTDPYVADPSLVPLQEALERADIIVIGVPHSVYRGLKVPAGKTVVDVWGFWPARADEAEKE
jgi:UDP-N-acetyl-D-mannosaminuronic acid dehydrogenase